MASRIVLTDMQSGHNYRLVGFETDSPEYSNKLYKMGFVEGTPIEMASVKISDPVVVQIRGSRIALRRSEAEQVIVEEI